jgi:hypothetical protein
LKTNGAATASDEWDPLFSVPKCSILFHRTVSGTGAQCTGFQPGIAKGSKMKA